MACKIRLQKKTSKFKNGAAASLALFTLLITSYAEATPEQHCLGEVLRVRPDLGDYEITRSRNLKPTKDLKSFFPEQGIFITQRDPLGNPVSSSIRVLADNLRDKIEVTGDFNHWDHENRILLHPDNDPHYVTGTVPHIFHGMQYRLVFNDKEIIDPAALVQATPEFNLKMYGRDDPFLNSVFWDIEGQGKYIPQFPRVALHGKAIAISENDIVSLAQNWPFQGRVGPALRGDTYNFIADSGIIDQLKRWGINAIEFLPLTASVDGDVWASRYLNFATFAIDSRWGTPREFARMVDAFNKAKIGVIMDIVPSHFTHRGNFGVRDVGLIGMHNQKRDDGQNLYGSILTEWNTLRYDYENPRVRKFLIDGIVNFIKYYGISGIRIDNYNGIENLRGGQQFLRELIATVKAYAPDLYINAESFGGDNSVTRRIDQGGHGNSTHNSGDFFAFIFEFIQKYPDQIDMHIIRDLLRHQWGWRENATLTYITNHDEAANSRGQASGAYLPTLLHGATDDQIEGRIASFACLAMFSGSFYLDMPHLRLLQEGTFYTNPAIQWNLLESDRKKRLSDFLAEATNYYTSEPAFAFENTHPDIESSTDYDNKIEVLKRIDFHTGKVIYIVTNLKDRSFENYRIGVAESGNFKLILDRDNAKFGGSGQLTAKAANGFDADDTPYQGKSHSLTLPYLGPNGVVILEK